MAKENQRGAVQKFIKLKLTKGEEVQLIRRAHNKSQEKMANAAGVSTHELRLWEADKSLNKATSLLLPHEFCFIKRRRAGLSQEQVAKKLKVCRYWLRLMETGKRDCTELLKYWSKK